MWSALTLMVCLWTLLACGVDGDDRMVRRYARCMADANTALHRLNVPSAGGTAALGTETVEERLRGQLERGEITMAKIKADHARYCE